MLRALLLLFPLLAAGLALNDPEFYRQWYLNPTRDDKIHINVQPVWQSGITGEGVRVAVVDSGVNDKGPELRKRVLTHLESNSWGNGISWQTWASQGHGTLAASVIAANRNNGNCGSGVAPGVNVIDVALFGKFQPTTANMAKALNIDNRIDISSNSWGSFDGGASLEPLTGDVRYSLEQGITQGRSQKGVIYVWAAGNGGGNGDSCAYEAHVNSRYTIAVNGVRRDGTALKSGEKCDGVLVAAPSRNPDDDKVWNAIVTPTGNGRGCQYTFSDTSAAAPMVSGVVALMLQAKPSLTWRDVQYILALTSSPCNLKNGQFSKNSVGLQYSPRFGFGVVNAAAAVNAAKSWRGLGGSIRCQAQKSGNSAHLSFYSGDFQCNGRINVIEHIIATITVMNKNYRGRITATLKSSSNTVSKLLTGRYQDFLPLGLSEWKVKSMRFLGEGFYGTWNINFDAIDTNSPVTVRLEVFGTSKKPFVSAIQPCAPPGTRTSSGNKPTTKATFSTKATTQKTEGACRVLQRQACQRVGNQCMRLVRKICNGQEGFGQKSCNNWEC